jgi:hypothetical protein
MYGRSSVSLYVHPSLCLPKSLFACSSACLFICLSCHMPAFSSVCVPICPSFHLYVCPSVCFSFYLFTVCLCVHLSVLSIHITVYLSVHPSVCSSICLFIHLSVHPSVCSSICLFIHLSVHPSVCSSTCRSIHHLHLSLYLSALLSVLHLSIFPFLRVCMSVGPPVHLVKCLSIFRFICPSDCVSVYALLHLFICSPVCLNV